MQTPIFLVCGLLESGKTTLIKNMFKSPDFKKNGPTLIIALEEGEVEYDEEFLKESNSSVVMIEDEEDFCEKTLYELDKKYNPNQILIEYNGMWDMDIFLDTEFPDNWRFVSAYALVNSQTAELYLKNLKSKFMDPLSIASLVIFNRYEDNINRGMFRRNIKALNMGAEIFFERNDGSFVDKDDEDLPFDVNSNLIEISDEDYAVWFIDTLEYPGHYIGKKVKFKAQFFKDDTLGEKSFVPGRFVMTCCEDDIQFLGHECRVYSHELNYQNEEWIDVEVNVDYEFNEEYGEDIPILYLERIEKTKKATEDIAYFI